MYKNFEMIMNEKGITSYRISVDTGIPQATFSRWKTGKCRPKVDKLIKIADYLGVPLEELIKEEVKTG